MKGNWFGFARSLSPLLPQGGRGGGEEEEEGQKKASVSFRRHFFCCVFEKKPEISNDNWERPGRPKYTNLFA